MGDNSKYEWLAFITEPFNWTRILLDGIHDSRPDPFVPALMLSYILRLADQFQRQHSEEPNLLYLNELHMLELKNAFASNHTTPSITDFLAMDIIISREITYPIVSLMQTAQRIAI